LILEKTIGEGEFGKVMSARALDKSNPQGILKTYFVVFDCGSSPCTCFYPF